MSIVLQSSGGGSITVQEPATASNFTQTLPTTNGTLATIEQIANGFRNRIINGDMRIDQRNAGASVAVLTNGNPSFSVDRFYCQAQGGGGYSIQQSSIAPQGFTNSIVATVTTADASVTGTDFYVIKQRIEGFNVADLGWGTANAKTVTLSFWVRSSLTGTFSGSLVNSAENRSYPYSYTISAANTWEQKSVTISGDTTGTWLTNNGNGVAVSFTLGVGATYQGTAGSWAGSRFEGATGQTQWISTSGATFYVTGVQLEVGSSATPFDTRAYGTELALCQRYFYKQGGVANNTLAVLANWQGVYGFGCLYYPVTMRAAPTFTYTSLSDFLFYQQGVTKTPISFGAQQQSVSNAELFIQFSGALTDGGSGFLRYNTSTSFITMSAEL